MRTRQRQYPPAKFVFGEPGRTGMAINSVISAGCVVSGAVVRNSVLSQDVRINSYAEVDASIIFTHVISGGIAVSRTRLSTATFICRKAQ